MISAWQTGRLKDEITRLSRNVDCYRKLYQRKAEDVNSSAVERLDALIALHKAENQLKAAQVELKEGAK